MKTELSKYEFLHFYSEGLVFQAKNEIKYTYMKYVWVFSDVLQYL